MQGLCKFALGPTLLGREPAENVGWMRGFGHTGTVSGQRPDMCLTDWVACDRCHGYSVGMSCPSDAQGATVTTIGEALRDARASRGLTIREVGRLVDAGESQISNWERGVNVPSTDVLRRYVLADLITAEQALGLDAA